MKHNLRTLNPNFQIIKINKSDLIAVVVNTDLFNIIATPHYLVDKTCIRSLAKCKYSNHVICRKMDCLVLYLQKTRHIIAYNLLTYKDY